MTGCRPPQVGTCKSGDGPRCSRCPTRRERPAPWRGHVPLASELQVSPAVVFPPAVTGISDSSPACPQTWDHQCFSALPNV